MCGCLGSTGCGGPESIGGSAGDRGARQKVHGQMAMALTSYCSSSSRPRAQTAASFRTRRLACIAYHSGYEAKSVHQYPCLTYPITRPAGCPMSCAAIWPSSPPPLSCTRPARRSNRSWRRGKSCFRSSAAPPAQRRPCRLAPPRLRCAQLLAAAAAWAPCCAVLPLTRRYMQMRHNATATLRIAVRCNACILIRCVHAVVCPAGIHSRAAGRRGNAIAACDGRCHPGNCSGGWHPNSRGSCGRCCCWRSRAQSARRSAAAAAAGAGASGAATAAAADGHATAAGRAAAGVAGSGSSRNQRSKWGGTNTAAAGGWHGGSDRYAD